jgi:pyruvate/oxaloacetate carboxyltransferase
MGADSICIKDMAGLLKPYDSYELVKALKENVKVPIHLHTHNTTGTGDMVNLMAAQAGVDIVDCALSPLANGTAQPATESLVATLAGTDRDTGLDLEKLSEATATEAFEGDVESTYEYKTDWNIGDIVQIENEFGITATSRIIEVIESEDASGHKIIPTFEKWEV